MQESDVEDALRVEVATFGRSYSRRHLAEHSDCVRGWTYRRRENNDDCKLAAEQMFKNSVKLVLLLQIRTESPQLNSLEPMHRF